MSHVLDACVVIAHLDPDDAHHGAATEALVAAATAPILAHPLTIAECLVGAVAADVGNETVERIRAMGVDIVEVDRGAPLRLAQLRSATRLRMPDCCVLDVAQQAGASVLTFDRRLAAAAQKLGVAVSEPTGP
jgi:predicted nucleic acid-binding protein